MTYLILKSKVVQIPCTGVCSFEEESRGVRIYLILLDKEYYDMITDEIYKFQTSQFSLHEDNGKQLFEHCVINSGDPEPENYPGRCLISFEVTT